jgi:putative SOS response-associated peptidase YedK
MCGKITQASVWKDAVDYADLIFGTGEDETVTPMHFAKIVACDDSGARRSVRMRWGLVPHWETDARMGSKHIHARAETIDTKPTFREAFARRRGILPVTSFNEGEEITPTKTRQYVITPKATLGIAVIWERWIGPEGMLLTFAMITTPANALIGTITDRMPAVLDETDWAKWLGEEAASPEELKAMLTPAEGDWDMQAAGKPPAPPKPENPQASLF